MKRPRGVLVLAVLIFLNGLLVTALGLFLLVLSVLHYTDNLPSDVVIDGWRFEVIDVLMAAAQFALGVFALVSSVGLWRLRPWAWLMAMLLLGCELVLQLSNYFQGQPNYALLALYALLVLYLNQRPIREAFSVTPKPPAVPSSIQFAPGSSASAVEPKL